MKITIDRKALFTLASETRINLLKELDKKRMTQSELSKELEISKTAVKEHLDKLEEAGLVERSEEGRKWIYYELTGKGKYVLHPGSKITITLMLSAAIATIGGGFFELYRYIMSKFALDPTLTPVPTPEPAPVEQPTPTPTPTPQPTTTPKQPVGPEATPSPTPAPTTETPTPMPTETAAPTEVPTSTGTPEPVPTSATETPAPVPTGTPPEVPTAPPAETPVPTPTAEPVTTPTATPAPTPTGTSIPEAAQLPPEVHLLVGVALIVVGALLIYVYRRR